MNNETYQRGLKLMQELHGGHSGEAIINATKTVCPDFADFTIRFAFGEIFARPGLDIKIRELAIIASCVTLGNAQAQLEAHIEAALNCGASKTEIVETILQTALYAGFPTVSNSLPIAEKVFNRMENLK